MANSILRTLCPLAISLIVLMAGCSSQSEREWMRKVEAGKKCYQEGDYSGSERWDNECLQYAEKEFGPASLEVAISLGNFARTLDKQRRIIRADSLYVRAADVYKRLGQEQNLSFANFSYNRAEHYGAMGRWSEAESSYADAQRLRLQFLGRDDPLVAMAYAGLGDAEARNGNLKEAVRNLSEAVRINRKVATPQAMSNLAMTLDQLADCYSRLGDTTRAFECLRESLSLSEKVSGRESAAFVHSLRTAAVCYLIQGKAHEADSCYLEAHAIAERQLSEDDPFLVILRTGAARALLREDKFAEAETLIGRAVNLSESQPGGDPAIHINALTWQAQIFYKTDRYAQALETIKKAMTCIDEAGASQQEFMVPCLNLAAKCAYKLGLDKDAVAYSRDAWERAKDLYGESDVKTLDCEKAYEKMRKDVSSKKSKGTPRIP
jgi:tetratricopeptide (TPR) repeat protein